MSGPDTPRPAAPPLNLPHHDPVAVRLAAIIHAGDLDALRHTLGERPELATARMVGRKGVDGGWRTPLHAATDWPGYFPAAPETIEILLAAGADPNATTGGERPETPLHWAASTDDLEPAIALIDGGADLETPGGSIGTPLDNAIGYGCWHVARFLAARGASVDKLWHAAALGMQQRIELLVDDEEPSVDALSHAFWHACNGGQRRAAEYLLARGAELNWIPDYADGTALDAANSRSTRQNSVITWLGDRGAASARSVR